MMKTKLKFLMMFLGLMVGGINGARAGEWNTDHDQVTFPFTSYYDGFNFQTTDNGVTTDHTGDITPGATIKKLGGWDIQVMNDNIYNALEGYFAVQIEAHWQVRQNAFEYTTGLTNTGSGARYLCILKLYAGDQVTITYEKASHLTGESQSSNNLPATFVTSGQASGKNAGDEVVSGITYTMAQDGTLDLSFPRQGVLKTVVIKHNSRHLSFTDASGNSVAGYQNNLPYYRYRLSSREFAEPTPSVFPTYSGGSLNYQYKIVNYGTSVGQKEVAVDPNYGTNGDIMFKNLGWCQVTVIAKDGNTEVARASYLVEVWDNEAYYEIENGNKYIFKKDPAISDDNQQGGVLKTRTVTAIPGVVAKFGIPLDNTEPNTTVVYKYTIESGQAGAGDHMVSFTNANDGWWDRYEHNDNTDPKQGTFYSFTASASGKLKFGGIKVPQTAEKKGTVYVVKWKDNSYQGRQVIFSQSQSGYLEYTTGLDIEVGTTYFLHGSADDNVGWSPFLLEWFSYETSLELSKSYGVATKPGKEITGTITTDAKVTLNNAALTTTVRNDINSHIEYVCKGNIDAATVSVDANDLITISNITYKNIGTNDDLKGGAIKVKVKNGTDVIEYVFTIPYGKHVWDFRRTADQSGATRPTTDDSYTDAELCTMMKTNTSDWNRVYKVHSKTGGTWAHLIGPLMVAGSKIEGDNAFYMSNTAGLIFITNDIESFGSEQTGFPSNYDDLSQDDQYLLGVESISATNLVWMKGTSTIYFPGVKENQYIKIYTYRHADDKGETYYVRNLVDLDGKSYSSTNATTNNIKIRGASEETGSGIQGDNISGAAIFRVPNGYTDTDVLTSMPSLTLCDDGWSKIFRIEITDDYYPDLKLQKDISAENTGRDDEVTFDSKAASVVVKTRNGRSIASVTTCYLGTSGNVHAQHANTPKYQIIPDAGVNVTAEIENWDSERHVSYNRLKLVFSGGSGNVRIIQREVANHAGTGVLVGHTETIGEGGAKTYTNNTPMPLISNSTGLSDGDYVIDKKEYRIAVGELAVQDYPYTWDFTNYHFGNSTTKTNMEGSNSSDSWQWTGKWPNMSLTTTGTKQMGTNAVATPNDDPYQEYNITVPMFAQGADLKATNSSTTVIAECEGLGVSQLMRNEKKYNTTTNISLNGNSLSGAGTITIPEVGNGMYVFVKSSAEPTSITGASAVGSNPFSVASNVRLYQNNTGSTQDVVLNFAASTTVEIVAVTNIVKGLDKFGYATESRDRAIDHTYAGKLTSNDVDAYIITTSDDYGSTYEYKGYPMVKKTHVASDIVPPNTGIVLCKEGHNGSPFTSPLFVPAVNKVPANNEASGEFWMSNWMIPNVKNKLHESEVTSRNEATSEEPSINTLPYYDKGVISTPAWIMNASSSTIFGSIHSDPVRYVDLAGYKELHIYQSAGDPVRCFFVDKNRVSGSDYAEITLSSAPVHYVNSGEYYSLDLNSIYETYGQVKLIGIKASAHNTEAIVSDVKAIPYTNPDATPCTKFVMTTSYYTYSEISNSFSEEKTATVESFYRVILDKNGATAAENNTLGANKALLLIPSNKLPVALWNKTSGSGSGARKGVIYIDLDEFEEQEATSVDNEAIIDHSIGNDVYYSISGTCISGKPTKKGFYIHNGKKVSVK